MATAPITLTPRAAQALKDRVASGPPGTKALRLCIKSTGCSGNRYEMQYVAAQDGGESDDRFEKDGAVLYVPKTESWMLFGTVVDYAVDSLGNERFVFLNPNEKGRCGCGESFNL